ncbi:MAG: Taurine import ATP-binding protein TauB [Candidatus Collierbacteria bacterium GW2011_GWA2_46_26]|uniref:Taurine import ATP-binding protein TauB n=1 Tax=Candidatus Collierbacteria bacterium GW2011_GWA2_46_26 TaxID=1618381 RepID=A0A0G1SGD4_9BACT|nr:MAG: Taurine import ATP-binding protein TauB [Candidatus Collierbacteria bacterium GW2011_GWA2_46_26]
MDGTPPIDGIHPLIADISVTKITKSFASNGKMLLVLDSVSFEIMPGEFVAVVGPNGCGKSTLLKVIGGLIKPAEGNVLIKGRIPASAQRRNWISYVFQNPALLPWRTVAENVRLPLEIIHKGRIKESNRRSKELLGMMGLLEFGDYFPHQLSGGMRQKVAVARALSFNPPILLMDEPFSAVDEMTRDALNLYLLDLWDRLKFTVVYITHSVKEAVFLADKIVVLSERPAKVKKIFKIELPRPRTAEMRYSSAYAGLMKAVSASLRETAALPMAAKRA